MTQLHEKDDSTHFVVVKFKFQILQITAFVRAFYNYLGVLIYFYSGILICFMMEAIDSLDETIENVDSDFLLKQSTHKRFRRSKKG
jgi:hypothetical protein